MEVQLRPDTLQLIRSLLGHLKTALADSSGAQIKATSYQIWRHCEDLLDTSNQHLKDRTGLFSIAKMHAKEIYRMGANPLAVAAAPEFKALVNLIEKVVPHPARSSAAAETKPTPVRFSAGDFPAVDQPSLPESRPSLPPPSTQTASPQKLTPELIEHLNGIMPGKGEADRREVVTEFDEFLQRVSPDLSQKKRAEMLGVSRAYVQK
jgi:hypothetical protein